MDQRGIGVTFAMHCLPYDVVFIIDYVKKFFKVIGDCYNISAYSISTAMGAYALLLRTTVCHHSRATLSRPCPQGNAFRIIASRMDSIQTSQYETDLQPRGIYSGLI